jgi:putative acetyltransferase
MIRRAQKEDLEQIFSLYQDTAAIPGGLARERDEITRESVAASLETAMVRGITLVALDGPRIVGEIHGSTPGIRVFRHIISDVTLCIHPDYQSRGWGRQLLAAFVGIVRDEMPQIYRIELIARESNIRAIRLYQSLGFVAEGCYRKRIRNPAGRDEDDIPMAWLRDWNPHS